MSQSQLPSVPAADVPAPGQDVVLLDVREPHEWVAGHVDGALHIPMGELPDRLAELPTLPDGADIAVVCHGGGRSARVTAWLLQQGVAARNVSGGMSAWAAAGRPMVSEDGQPPRVD